MPVPPRIAVPALMALHALLAGFGLGRESLWLDEVMSVEMATGSWEVLRGWFIMLPEQHPLYYMVLRPWLALFGTSDLALRSLSLLFGVASVGGIYLLGRRVFDDAVGVVSSALLAVSPFWIYYSQEGRMYTLLVLLAIAASLLWLDYQEKLRRGDHASLLAYWVVGILGMYTHIFFAFVVMGHALASALRDDAWRKNGAEGLKLGLPVLVGYLPWLILVLTHMPEGQGWKDIRHVIFGIPYTLVRFAVGYGELLANYRWQERIVELLQANAPVLALAVATHGLLFLLGAAQAARLRRTRKAFVASGLLLPLFLPLAISPVVLLSGERYFMVVLPIYLLILASGLMVAVRSLERPGVRRVAAGGLVLGFAVLSARTVYAHHFEPDFGKEQWEEVVQAMADSPPGTPVVVTPTQSINTLRYHVSEGTVLDPRAWDGQELDPSPTGEMWLVVARLEDPELLVAALPQGWSVERRRLYPQETGLWLIEATRSGEAR